MGDFNRCCMNCDHRWNESTLSLIRRLRASSSPVCAETDLESFNDLEAIHAAGFRGFRTVSELRNSSLTEVPTEAGVYMVVRDSLQQPNFLDRSLAGWNKGKDPSVKVDQLHDAWVHGGFVLYIGKAGGAGVESNLRTRLRAYLRHGAGHRAPHWGGRYIWQLEDAEELRLVWRPTLPLEPRTVEKQLIQQFEAEFGTKPFANRVH